MSAIQGVQLSDAVVPFDTRDINPSHYDIWGYGGYRSVNTYSDLANIPDPRLSEGMLVYIRDSGLTYQYISSSWKIKIFSLITKSILLGNGVDIIVGADVLNVITTPGISTDVFTLYNIKINTKIAPFQDLVVDIKINNVSILNSYIKLLSGTITNSYQSFDNNIFNGGERITLDVLNASGMNVTIELEFIK